MALVATVKALTGHPAAMSLLGRQPEASQLHRLLTLGLVLPLPKDSTPDRTSAGGHLHVSWGLMGIVVSQSAARS